MQITEMITDETLRELRPHGRPGFHFEYYYDDILKYTNQMVDWHWHTEFEFLWVEEGPIDCRMEDGTVRVYPGDGLFINSGIIHRFEAPAGGKMPNILFAPDFFAEKTSIVYEKYILPVLQSGCSWLFLDQKDAWGKEILKKLEEIYQTAQKEQEMREIQITAQTSSLWCSFFEGGKTSFVRKKTEGSRLLHGRLQKMLEFIRQNYGKRISLEEIAESAGISKTEALRCFHSGVGSTPVTYLNEYRLGKAKELLAETDRTVTQIAAETGFDSSSYFTRCFTGAFGMNPMAFRKADRMIKQEKERTRENNEHRNN